MDSFTHSIISNYKYITQKYISDASHCMPSCDEMKTRVNKLSDPKFIGEIKTKKQKCENTKGRTVNFALLAGLTGSDMLFGTGTLFLLLFFFLSGGKKKRKNFC